MAHDWTHAAPSSSRDAPINWDGGAPPAACHDQPGAQIFAIHQLSATLLDTGYESTPAGWAVPRDGMTGCADLES